MAKAKEEKKAVAVKQSETTDEKPQEKKAKEKEADEANVTVEDVKKEDPKAKRSIKQTEAELAEEVLKAKKAKTAKKAGPKAARARKETEEEPKAEAKPEKPKVVVQPARPRSERRGKKYREAFKAIDRSAEYKLDEAVQLLPKTSFVKFDPSVELHINLGVDPKQADQMVRGTVVLPHGSGKSQRVGVVAGGDKAKAAKEAGADVVGEDDLLEKIGKGQFDFDILVATPDVMSKLGKFAKQLGPKGLMPNPKSGTVTSDIAKTVKELKGGRIEFRIDSGGIIHQAVGKLSLKPEQLLDNIKALLKAVSQAKPADLKGAYVKKITLTTSMGPGLKLNASQTLKDL